MKKILFVVSLLLLMGCAPTVSYKVRDGFTFNKTQSILVLQKPNDLGSGDTITEALMDTKLKIIDRTTLDQIVQEQKLNLSGAVADSDLETIGKLTKADLILTYRGQWGNGYANRWASVSIRVIEVKTGNIVFTTTAKNGDMMGGVNANGLIEGLNREAAKRLVDCINGKKSEERTESGWGNLP